MVSWKVGDVRGGKLLVRDPTASGLYEGVRLWDQLKLLFYLKQTL